MQGRLIPRLVGFLSPIEREFFDMFCEVDGVGVKKALRAMVRPVQEVATMIEEQDAKGLATLPGIGPATADRIIAKLRRRVPKFALLVAREMQPAADVERDLLTRSLRSAPRPGPQRMPMPAGCSTAPSTRKRSTKTSIRCCTPSMKRPTASRSTLSLWERAGVRVP